MQGGLSRSLKNSLKWKVLADIGVFSPEVEGARIRVPHSAVARDRRRDAVVNYLKEQGGRETRETDRRRLFLHSSSAVLANNLLISPAVKTDLP